MNEAIKPQPHSGNTTLNVSNFRGRSFQLTCNTLESYLASVQYLKKSQMLDYIISCRETAPTTGHVHYHIYVHFNNARVLKLDKLKGAHVEVCRGSAVQNIDYIKKNGDILLEEGVAPINNSLNIAELKKIKSEDDLPDWKQHKLWSTLQSQLTLNIDDWYKQVKVYYISGPSGIGKSNKAKSIVKESNLGSEFNLVKHRNNFWMGVSNNTKIAIYDDFRDTDLSPSEFVNFIDYNRQLMNTKGGYIVNNYELIIITSIIDLDCIYIYNDYDQEPREQWLRRIEWIKMK